MPVTLNSSGISFSDGNSQNSAASAGAGIQGTSITQYNSTTNLTFPSTSAAVIAKLGGGGGGGAHWTGFSTGGTGGSAYGIVPRAAVGNSFNVTIGGGGSGIGGGQVGPSGGATYLSSTNIVIANGGAGGQGNTNARGATGSGGGNYGVQTTGVGGNGSGWQGRGQAGKALIAFIG